MKTEVGTKEVVKKQNYAVSTDVADMFEGMDYGNVETKDLLIPKILLMQGQSDKVLDGTCKAGDIIKSTTGEVYGSARERDAKALRFIPVYMYKTWVKQEVLGKGKMQYIETYPVTPLNTDQKWEQVVQEDGLTRTFKLTKNINFYIILEQDFGNALAVPHVLTFRSTSARAADIIESWFAECNVAQKARQPKNTKGELMLPFARIFELAGKLESNDDNSWYVYKTTDKGAVPAEDTKIAQAFSWYKEVSKYDHLKEVDNSDEVGAPKDAVKSDAQVKF
jgi:hypothetical protein